MLDPLCSPPQIKTNDQPCAFGCYYYKDDRVNIEYCTGLYYEGVYKQVGDHQCVLRLASVSHIVDIQVRETQGLSCPSTGDLVRSDSNEQSITYNQLQIVGPTSSFEVEGQKEAVSAIGDDK